MGAKTKVMLYIIAFSFLHMCICFLDKYEKYVFVFDFKINIQFSKMQYLILVCIINLFIFWSKVVIFSYWQLFFQLTLVCVGVYGKCSN